MHGDEQRGHGDHLRLLGADLRHRRCPGPRRGYVAPMRCVCRLICALLALGCDPSEPDLDAGIDARVPSPQMAFAGDERATLIVETDPLRFRVERADGSVALTSSPAGLRLGTAPRADERFHDPTLDVPPTVVWQALDLGESASESTLRVADAEGRAATGGLQGARRRG